MVTINVEENVAYGIYDTVCMRHRKDGSSRVGRFISMNTIYNTYDQYI